MVRRTLAGSLYLLIAWPLQLALFCVNVTLVAAACSIVLAPVTLPAAVLIAAGGAQLEQLLVTRLLGMDMSRAHYLRRHRAETPTQWTKRVATSPQAWLDLLWSLVAWAVSIVTWAITIMWWSMVIGCLTWPAYGWILHGRKGNQDLAYLLGVHSLVPAMVLYVALGLVFLAGLPFAVTGLVRLQVLADSALLCRQKDQEQIVELTRTRDAGRAAESAQLTRLERDIHDGPQQRLVRLKMDLARMERQVGDDSHAILGLRAAIASTQETLEELRALSKGIAPPVLSDRGLVAAVREAAARATIPVTVEAELGEAILPPHVEQAAYFVVSEALTNVAKHSGARSGLVLLRVNGTDLDVSVTDDGVGGAHLSKGSGLVGLDNRVRSVGGTLTLDSPVGGPTTVVAMLPLT